MHISNLFHKTSQLEDPLSQELLQLSDGTRTNTDLLAALTDFASKQGLTAGANSITAPAEIRALLAQGLEQNLQKLWTMGLLSAPLHPAAARTIGNWFPFAQRSWANGIVTAAAIVGVAVSYPGFGALIKAFDWPAAFLIFRRL